MRFSGLRLLGSMPPCPYYHLENCGSVVPAGASTHSRFSTRQASDAPHPEAFRDTLLESPTRARSFAVASLSGDRGEIATRPPFPRRDGPSPPLRARWQRHPLHFYGPNERFPLPQMTYFEVGFWRRTERSAWGIATPP